MCNSRLFKVLFVNLCMYSMSSLAMEPKMDVETSLEKTLGALTTTTQMAGEHIAETQQAREEEPKGTQTATVTPVQVVVQPIIQVKRRPQPLPTVNKAAQDQLIKAILDGSVEGVKKAINAGADVNFMSSNDLTPVWLTLLLRDFSIVNTLLELGARADTTYDGIYKGMTFLRAIVREGYIVTPCLARATLKTDPLIVKCLLLLLEKGTDFSSIQDNRPQMAGIADYVFCIVTRLWKPDMPQTLRSDILDLMQKITDRGYNVAHVIRDSGVLNDETLTEKSKIYLYGDKDIIDFCKKNQTDHNPVKASSLASGRQSMPGQSIPMDYNKSDLERLNPDLNSLFLAILKSDVEGIKLIEKALDNPDLRKIGAVVDINQLYFLVGPDCVVTPLDYAIRQNRPEAIRFLMIHGAKTFKELQLAEGVGLQEKIANAQATSLLWVIDKASIYGITSIERLLDAGLQDVINRKTVFGIGTVTPLDYALKKGNERGFTEVIQFLKKRGAKTSAELGLK